MNKINRNTKAVWGNTSFNASEEKKEKSQQNSEHFIAEVKDDRKRQCEVKKTPKQRAQANFGKGQNSTSKEEGKASKNYLHNLALMCS
jgi:hypothetical protein